MLFDVMLKFVLRKKLYCLLCLRNKQYALKQYYLQSNLLMSASRGSADPARPAYRTAPFASYPRQGGPAPGPVPAPWAGVGPRVPGSLCPPGAQPSPLARGFREVHWGRDVLSPHLLIQLFMAISVGSPTFIFAYGFHPRTSLLCSPIFVYCISSVQSLSRV